MTLKTAFSTTKDEKWEKHTAQKNKCTGVLVDLLLCDP